MCLDVCEKDPDAASAGDISDAVVYFIDGWRTSLEVVFVHHLQHKTFEFYPEIYLMVDSEKRQEIREEGERESAWNRRSSASFKPG